MRVPPRKHLLKMEARLHRLEDMGLHELLRPDNGQKMPPKRERTEYMELHVILIGKNLPELLDALLGRDDEVDQ